MDAAAPDTDEVWTVGQAADFLNAGGVNFGFTPKRVRFMAKDPGCQIRAVSGGSPATPGPGRRRSWYRLLASTVRAERARLLAEAGRVDPDQPGSHPV